MIWGLYVSLALIAVTLLFYATGNILSSVAVYINYLIYIAGIVLVTQSYKKSVDESTPFPYGKALGLGVATMFYASIVMAVFTFILYKFIDPSLIDQFIEYTEDTFLKSGMSEDMVEQYIKLSKPMMTPAVMSMSQLFSVAFYGFLISLITSIFLRKKAETGFDSAMREIDNEEE